MPDTPARWLSPAAAAAYLGIARSTLRKLVASGLVPQPAYHLGRRLPRFDRDALDRALAGQAVGEAVDMLIAEAALAIRQRPHRPPPPRRRHGARVSLPAVPTRPTLVAR